MRIRNFILPILFLFIINVIPQLASGQTAEKSRRIEELKRDSFQGPTEVTRTKNSKTKTHSISEKQAFIQAIIDKKVATHKEAIQTVIILLGKTLDYRRLPEQTQYLFNEKITPPHLQKDFSPDTFLTKGVLAYMYCKALHIRGGVISHLIGLNERYAVKELVFQEIMPPGSPDDPASGLEVIYVLQKSVQYLLDKQNIEQSQP